MMPARTSLVLLLVVLVFSGCATAPTPVANPEKAWTAHRARLANVDHWDLTGRIAVHTEEEGGHARLVWRQNSARYDILISGPFGSGRVRLTGDSNQAVLAVDNKPPVSARDPELLLYQQTGWWIPVEALRYWILGLPAPRLSASWQLDPRGRLDTLEQAGWRIRFFDYQQRDGLELPGRVFVSNGPAEVRVVVQTWSTAKGAPATISESSIHGR